ncbi:MAG: hypothetical protein WBB23_14540 [Desulforhopalus sp.]
MKTVLKDTYRGWEIKVKAEQIHCSNFSFDIVNPSGKTQQVALGGDNEQRVLERARDMIDMEIELAADN